MVHNRVPFLHGNDFLAGVAAELGSTAGASVVDTLTPEFLQTLAHDFFEGLYAEFVTQVPSLQLDLLTPVARANFDKSTAQQHCLTRLPADPTAKLTKRPAMRQHADIKQPPTFGSRIHCDLVGPTRPSINGEIHAWVTRDEATGYPSAQPLRSKTADATAAAWDKIYGGKLQIRAVRTDS